MIELGIAINSKEENLFVRDDFRKCTDSNQYTKSNVISRFLELIGKNIIFKH